MIGGSSHVGKTLIAHKLMEKHNIPYFSLDYLKMAFVNTRITDLTLEDDYELRYAMWPFVVEIIKAAVDNKQNLILEGCYIPAEWQDSFPKSYLKEIQSVFVVMSENYIRTNQADIFDYADVIQARIDDVVDIERLVNCSIGFKEDAIENQIPYLEISEKFDIDEIVLEAEELLNISKE